MYHSLLALIADLIASQAHAAGATNINNVCSLYGSKLGTCGLGATFVATVATEVKDLALDFVLSACVIGVIVGGIRIMSSGIDEGGREQGKTIIKFALIGMVLSLSVSYLLGAMGFIKDFLTAPGL